MEKIYVNVETKEQERTVHFTSICMNFSIYAIVCISGGSKPNAKYRPVFSVKVNESMPCNLIKARVSNSKFLFATVHSYMFIACTTGTVSFKQCAERFINCLCYSYSKVDLRITAY